MNYKRIYNQLIRKRKVEKLEKLQKTDPKYQYCESHHIIPKCLGGSNSKSNIINLTFREHYICHLLLVFHYRSINDKNAFNKMKRALKSFENLDYGTCRNEIFFANSLFKNLTRSYKMSRLTKMKISKAKKGKSWTQAQRDEWEKRKEYNKKHEIKQKAWNKGIPLSDLTKKRMKRTIKKNGNTNLGKKMESNAVKKECFTRLSHKYPDIDWRTFDFDAYIRIPKNAYVSPTPKFYDGKRLYLRHKMIFDFILSQVSYKKYLEMKNSYNKGHPNGYAGKKHKKKTRKKIFIERHKFFFPDVDWDSFDFDSYEKISKKKHRKYIKQFIENQTKV